MSSNTVRAIKAQEDEIRTCSTHRRGQKCTKFYLLETPTNRIQLGDLDIDGTKENCRFYKTSANDGTNRI
jgi:hypothetical protein